MKKATTITDIAAALNTNASTVSRALNNNPRISDEMRRKVHKKAMEMGYQPNAIAKQLKEGHSLTIGLIVPRINRFFFSNVIHGVESVAKKEGYHVLICQSNDSQKEEYDCLNLLASQNVAGIIMSLASDSTETDFLNELISKGKHIVLFDRVHTNLPIKTVLNSNRESSYLATKHLLEQGYRKIVHFGGPLSSNVYQKRFKGYKEALEEFGIPLDENLVFHSCLTRKEGEQTTQVLLQHPHTFDAICSASDFSALGAMYTLKANGLKIPEDIGIVGFANEPFTELIGLSSVEQFGEDIGKSTAQLLLDDLKQEQTDTLPKKLVIPAQLMLRESSLKK